MDKKTPKEKDAQLRGGGGGFAPSQFAVVNFALGKFAEPHGLLLTLKVSLSVLGRTPES